MEQYGRPAPGARFAKWCVEGEEYFIPSWVRLTRIMHGVREKTSGILYAHPRLHRLSLTAAGALTVLVYEHAAVHFGLPHAPDVFLAACISGGDPNLIIEETTMYDPTGRDDVSRKTIYIHPDGTRTEIKHR